MHGIQRGAGGHGAENTIKNDSTISNGVDWYQDIRLVDSNGDQVTGVSLDEFQFQFRKERTPGSTADLVISTADAEGHLAVNEGATQTLLEVRVAQATLAAMSGFYFVDLVSKADLDDRLIHRACGGVTFRDDPIAF